MPESLLLSPRTSLCREPSGRPPRPPPVAGSYSSQRAGVLVRRLLGRRRDPSEVHAGAGVQRVVAGADPLRADHLGGRAVPARRPHPAPAWRPVAGGPDAVLRGRRHGVVLRRDGLRARGLRPDPAERAHGPAHDAVDARPAGSRARRAGHAGAADPAAPAARLAAGGAALPGRPGAVLPAADAGALRHLAVGAVLLRLVRRVAALDVRPRDDAPAPGARRFALLLAADGHRPGARAGRLPGPDAAGGADAAVPRLPGRGDHEPGHPDRAWLVPVAAQRPDGLLAARPAGRPAPRGRDPVGLGRPDRTGLLRRAVRAVGALVDEGGGARGPAAGPARGACRGPRGRHGGGQPRKARRGRVASRP